MVINLLVPVAFMITYLVTFVPYLKDGNDISDKQKNAYYVLKYGSTLMVLISSFFLGAAIWIIRGTLKKQASMNQGILIAHILVLFLYVISDILLDVFTFMAN